MVRRMQQFGFVVISVVPWVGCKSDPPADSDAGEVVKAVVSSLDTVHAVVSPIIEEDPDKVSEHPLRIAELPIRAITPLADDPRQGVILLVSGVLVDRKHTWSYRDACASWSGRKACRREGTYYTRLNAAVSPKPDPVQIVIRRQGTHLRLAPPADSHAPALHYAIDGTGIDNSPENPALTVKTLAYSFRQNRLVVQVSGDGLNGVDAIGLSDPSSGWGSMQGFLQVQLFHSTGQLQINMEEYGTPPDSAPIVDQLTVGERFAIKGHGSVLHPNTFLFPVGVKISDMATTR